MKNSYDKWHPICSKMEMEMRKVQQSPHRPLLETQTTMSKVKNSLENING